MNGITELTNIIFLNFIYATVLGGGATLLLMFLGFKVFDRLTPFKTKEELDNGNIAVGIVIGCFFIGLGVAMGLTIGLGLN